MAMLERPAAFNALLEAFVAEEPESQSRGPGRGAREPGASGRRAEVSAG